MRLIKYTLALWLLLGVSCANAAIKTPVSGAISKVTLDNGLTVILKEDHATSLVALDVWVKNGTRYETSQNNGVSHFIEHMIFKGTTKRSAGQIDREIEDLGGSLGAATSKDWTHFYTTVASKYFPTALTVVSDALINPTFPADEMEKERSVILEEIARNQSLAQNRIFGLLADASFKEHPYRFPITGTPESVARLKREDLVSYYASHYSLSNMVVVAVGDVKPSEVIDLIKTAFTAASKKSQPASQAVVAAEPAQTEVRRVEISTDLKNNYLQIGFHAAAVKDRPDVYALDLLTIVLGQGGRNRLGSCLAPYGVRSQDIQVDYLTQKDPGLFSITITLPDLSKAAEIEKAVIKELNVIAQSPVSDAELAYSQSILLGEYAFMNETYAGQANTFGFYSCVDDYSFALNYVDEISKRTPGELQAAAAKYFKPESYTLVLLKSKGKVD